VLRQFQGGVPFNDALYISYLSNLESDHVYFSMDEMFDGISLTEMTVEQKCDWYRERIRRFILHTLGVTTQTDIVTRWRAIGTIQQQLEYKKDIIWATDLMKVNGTKLPLVDVLIRFLLLVGVLQENLNSPLPDHYGAEFIDLLVMFVENNGKAWQTAGENVRRDNQVIQNPLCGFEHLGLDIVGQNLLEKEEDVHFMDECLSEPMNLEIMLSEDPNRRRPLLMVSMLCTFVFLFLLWLCNAVFRQYN